MLGLVLLVLYIADSVLYHNGNSVVALATAAPYLYKWHLYTAILMQIMFFVGSLAMLIVGFVNKDKEKEPYKDFAKFSVQGFAWLFTGATSILGSLLLLKAVEGNPTTLSEFL